MTIRNILPWQICSKLGDKVDVPLRLDFVFFLFKSRFSQCLMLPKSWNVFSAMTKSFLRVVGLVLKFSTLLLFFRLDSMLVSSFNSSAFMFFRLISSWTGQIDRLASTSEPPEAFLPSFSCCFHFHFSKKKKKNADR